MPAEAEQFSPAAMAVGWDERGKRGFLYAYRPLYENYKSGSLEDCAGAAAFSSVYSICDGVCVPDRFGCKRN